MADLDLDELTAVVTPAGTDLVYTVQGGVDKKLTVTQINSLASGGAGISGTPVNNQLAVWTGATDIEGDANLTWDATQLLFVQIGDLEATPSLAFGDGDTGFYERTDDRLFCSIAGTEAFEFHVSSSVATFEGIVTGSAALRNINASATEPSFCPDGGDLNTGIGHPSTDEICFIAGGLTAVQYKESLNGIQRIDATAIGLTASVTQTQGQEDLDFSYSEVATVANANDVVTAPRPEQGTKLRIVNNGANTLQIFPDTSDDLGAGTNVSISLEPTQVFEAMGMSATLWQPIYHGPQVPTIGIVAGSASAPSVSFVDNLDTGFYSAADNDIGVANNGINYFLFEPAFFKGANAAGPLVWNQAATSTAPTLLPNQADLDTGVGWRSANKMVFVAEGAAVAEIHGAPSARQVIVAPTVQNQPGTPSLGFGDGDCGFYESSDDVLRVSHNGVFNWAWTAGVYGAAQAAGPAMLNEDASSTNPTLVPNQADADTGLGRGGVDRLNLIAGGVTCLSVEETGGSTPQVGFYATAPISLQTGVAVTAAGVHAALVALGLITA